MDLKSFSVFQYSLMIVLMLAMSICRAQERHGKEGLYFASHEVNQDQRTSLNITPEGSIRLKKGLEMEFDANFREGDGYYGDVFRIVANDSVNIDFVSNLFSAEDNFWIVVKDRILVSLKWSDIPNGGFDQWMKIKIGIHPDSNTLTFSMNDHKVVKELDDFKNLKHYQIIFGKNSGSTSPSTDVCPMSVKHIKIFDGERSLKRHWALGKHTKDNKVYDEVSKAMAVAENPKWIMDQHFEWKKMADFSLDSVIGLTKDVKGQRIFMVTNENVISYSYAQGKIDTISYVGAGTPYPCKGNTIIYDPYRNLLWSYSFEQPEVSYFDFDTRQWSLSNLGCEEVNYWHHNPIFSPKDSSLITFGGYGHYLYKGEIKNVNYKNPNWDTYKKGDSIYPRYLGAAGGYDENSFLIFGGYGSKSGRQEVNSQNFYDLYSVSYKDFGVKKLWETERLNKPPFVPLESLQVAEDGNSFYTLLYNNTNYNTYLKLAKIGIDSPEMTIYPDSIPFQFLDVKSFGSFFLDPKESKLVAMTEVDGKVNINALDYPPMEASEVFQTPPVDPKFPSFALIVGILIIGGATGGYLIWKKRKGSVPPKAPAEQAVSQPVAAPEPLETMAKPKPLTSTIYLFGGFQVYAQNGDDITAMFTPTLKQLFLLILLHSLKGDKGISSPKLTECLWYDKSENSARNNRNVNISKLRLILEKIGKIELSNENTYWRIKIGKDVFCDYQRALSLATTLEDGPAEPHLTNEFIGLVAPGEICPDVQTEWIDPFKVKIANRIIDVLESVSHKQENLDLQVQLADTILKYDPLNEEAIALKCQSLYKSGKKTLAKHCYDSFCSEYQTLLNTKYETSFKNILNLEEGSLHNAGS